VTLGTQTQSGYFAGAGCGMIAVLFGCGFNRYFLTTPSGRTTFA
jgi:hypothetical protein